MPAKTDLIEQHERALALLGCLHPCITIDGPPEEVAQRIFDHVQAQGQAYEQRIASLRKSLEYFQTKQR